MIVPSVSTVHVSAVTTSTSDLTFSLTDGLFYRQTKVRGAHAPAWVSSIQKTVDLAPTTPLVKDRVKRAVNLLATIGVSEAPRTLIDDDGEVTLYWGEANTWASLSFLADKQVYGFAQRSADHPALRVDQKKFPEAQIYTLGHLLITD